MIKVSYLYKIFPVKCKDSWIGYHTGMTEEELVKVIGFWGFIFKIFKIDWYGKLYKYQGNYFRGLYRQYKFNKMKNKKEENKSTISTLKV